MQQVKVTMKLSTCYPDIEDELCNRHTIYLTKISHKFEQLYNKNKPMFFVIAKGICEFKQENKLEGNQQSGGSEYDQKYSMMAIQNGVVIAVAKTQSKGNIYINYNKWQQLADMHQNEQFSQQTATIQQNLTQQLILNYKSQIQQSVNLTVSTELLCKQLAEVYQMAVQDISLNKINGAIMYISTNIPQNNLYQKEALIYAFYMAILKVNQVMEEYSMKDICEKLRKFYKNKEQIMSKDNEISTTYDSISKYSKIFNMGNRTILLNSELQNFEAKGDKFLFIKLPANLFGKNKNKIGLKLLQFQKVLFKHNNNLLCVLSEMKEKFKQITKDLKDQESIKNILDKTFNIINGFFVAENGQYLVLYVPGRYCAELIKNLAKQIKQSSKTQDNSEQNKNILEVKNRKNEIIYGKWNRNTNINQYIFTSLPSTGFSILDPSQQIWFNQ